MGGVKATSGNPGSAKDWTVKIFLLCFTITICLGMGEIIVRGFVGDIFLAPRYHTDAVYGDFVLRRLRPNSVFWHTSRDGSWKFVTNTQGFRDTEDYAYDKPEGLLRVISLGDSQTQGFEVRQRRTFSEVIERALKARGIEAQVLNTGISGFSTAEELAFLENEGIKYKPDVVVLGFFGNDFSDNLKAGLFALEHGELVVKRTTHTPGVRILKAINAVAPLRWLSENSHLYSLAMNTVWDTAKRLLLSRSEAALQTEYAIPTEQITAYKETLMVRLLERMYEFCRKRGIRLIIVDIPAPSKPGGDMFRSSVPPAMVPEFRSNSDAFISSDEALGDYRNVAEFHLPHGHRHISEFTHLMLGLAAARAIVEGLGGQAADRTKASNSR